MGKEKFVSKIDPSGIPPSTTTEEDRLKKLKEVADANTKESTVKEPVPKDNKVYKIKKIHKPIKTKIKISDKYDAYDDTNYIYKSKKVKSKIYFVKYGDLNNNKFNIKYFKNKGKMTSYFKNKKGNLFGL
jgi:hypothetical protein